MMNRQTQDWHAGSGARLCRRGPSHGTHAERLFVRRARVFCVLLLAAALWTGCGDTRPAQEPEGSIAFQSGTGSSGVNRTHVTDGPPFQRPGLLVPAYEPTWQSAWVEHDQQHPLLRGATAGLTTGIAILEITPFALTFWPAAVGIMAGATAMSMLGISQSDPADQRISPPDRVVIADATKSLRPDALWRESAAEAFAQSRMTPVATVTSYQAWGPDTSGTDPLVEARAQGLDGVLEFSIDALGLAAGEEKDTFGVFVQVRVRAVETQGGLLRYERVVSYGPGQQVEGLPRADFYTVEFLAADQARVYRQMVSDGLRRLARVVAEDPQLPLPPFRAREQ